MNVLPELAEFTALERMMLIILSFALFGNAVLRVDVFHGTVGLLLLAEAIGIFLVFVVLVLATEEDSSNSGAVGIESVQALLLLDVAYFPRRDGSRLEHAESTHDTAK